MQHPEQHRASGASTQAARPQYHERICQQPLMQHRRGACSGGARARAPRSQGRPHEPGSAGGDPAAGLRGCDVGEQLGVHAEVVAAAQLQPAQPGEQAAEAHSLARACARGPPREQNCDPQAGHSFSMFHGIQWSRLLGHVGIKSRKQGGESRCTATDQQQATKARRLARGEGAVSGRG